MPSRANGGAGGFFSSFYKEQSWLGWWAIARVIVGYTFITAGWTKYHQNWLSPNPQTEPLARVLRTWTSGREFTPDWYQSLLERVVLPNAHLFGILVAAGELALGVLLIAGLLTRLAGVVGAFMTANYSLAAGHFPPTSLVLSRVIVVLCLLLALSAAGRAWGADYYLHRAWKRWPLS